MFCPATVMTSVVPRMDEVDGSGSYPGAGQHRYALFVAGLLGEGLVGES